MQQFVKGPMWEQFVKNCRREGLTLEKFVDSGLPWKAAHAGPGEGLQSLRRKAAVETTWDGLTVVPIPCILHHWRKEVEN